MSYTFLTDCIHSTCEAISNMVEDEREITWRTFSKHVHWTQVRDLFPDYSYHGETYNQAGELTIGFHLKDDVIACSFHKSIYIGELCYFIRHSGIEYIFIEE